MYVDDGYLLKQLVKQSSDILYNQSSVWRKKRPNLKIRAISVRTPRIPTHKISV